jgi:hypothetical protein
VVLRSAETQIPCVAPCSESGFTGSVFRRQWLYRIGQLTYCLKNNFELAEHDNEGEWNEIAYDEAEVLGLVRNSEGEKNKNTNNNPSNCLSSNCACSSKVTYRCSKQCGGIFLNILKFKCIRIG